MVERPVGCRSRPIHRTTALGQEGPVETLAEMYAKPAHCYLFDQGEEGVAEFKTDCPIRICVSQRAHKIPLVINYDGKTAK